MQEREFDALHSVRSIDSNLMRYMLRPKLLAKIGKTYEDAVRCHSALNLHH